jgi:hypothetical protein
MNRFACIFVALGLAAAGSTALAAEPAMMTDAQMDNVTAGGGLIDVIIKDNLNNLSVDVIANVNAMVNANVLVNAPVNVNVNVNANVLTGLGL